MKIKTTFLALAMAILAIFCSCSQDDGDLITQEFNINGAYTELRVENAFDVTVSNTVDQVTVLAGKKIMPKIKVKLTGNTLKIYLDGWSISHGSMKVLLPANPELRKVVLSGASEFYGDMAANNVEIVLSGASDINGGVMATSLNLTLSGSSSATLDGQVGELTMNLSGSSELEQKEVNNHYSLVCNECEGSLSGSSDAYIHCDGNIRVDVSGSSRLHYTGNASTSGSKTSGGSDITHDVL